MSTGRSPEGALLRQFFDGPAGPLFISAARSLFKYPLFERIADPT